MIHNYHMNKIVIIGIIVLIVIVGSAVALNFNDNTKSNTTTTQVGQFSVESTSSFTSEKSEVGNDYSLLLEENIGMKENP